MLDLKQLSRDPEDFARRLGRRGSGVSLEPVLALNTRRVELIKEGDALRNRQKTAQKEMGRADKKSEAFAKFREEMKTISDRIKAIAEEQRQVDADLTGQLQLLPNIPDAEAPDGKSEEDNVVLRGWGEKPEFDFEARPHWEIGEALGVLDFERASKIAKARFTVYRGAGARLERALINFMLDLHTGEHGYTEMLPPFLVNTESMLGSGQYPKFRDDAFELTEDNLVLVPTSEVSLVNLHRDEILEGETLPLRFAAFSACFRKEAGSYGRDTRGLIRQHQFQKVELVHLCDPEESDKEHAVLLQSAETVLQKLGLHYRVVDLCTGDLGFGATRTYDLEVWLPGMQAYREISSCSNCRDFQARRSQIRVRRAGEKKPSPLHTLNGSGLAVGRTVVALLENYQQADGSVVIPEALRPYMGGLEIITPNPA